MGAQWKFINENYNRMEGYKRVAWPPASEERIVREFTPQPQSQSPTGQYYSQPTVQPQQQQQQQQQQQPTQQQYRASSYEPQQPIQNQVPSSYNQQAQQQQQQPQHQPSPAPIQNQYQAPSQQPSWAHQQQQYQQPQQYQAALYKAQSPLPQQQQQFYNTEPKANQFNSYSQPQPQPLSQDQLDNPYQQQQPLPHDYRGGSPGIITLRKETPVSQRPVPVYNAEPAAVSYQGGSKLRGDLKWPPPEYKEAAARENEERRNLALGPVCRPRKVNRDFTSFFAKNALNSYYPTYKVPPGTQHMLA